MIRTTLAIIVAALPATSRLPPATPAPIDRRVLDAVPGFAAALADRPLDWGAKAWPRRADAASWAAIASARPAQLQSRRWVLAQSLIGRGRAADALGVLEVMAADDPDLPLVPAWRRAHGVTLVLLGRVREASLALADERLAGDPETCLWRLRAAAEHAPGPALAALGCALPALASRGKADRQPFVLAAAAAAIRIHRDRPALAWLGDTSPADMAANLLRAQAMHATGQHDQARLLLARIARAGSAEQRAAAELASIEAGIVAGTLSPVSALRRLDDLRLGWRGDAIERRALTLSVDLAARVGDLPGGLAAGAVLFRYFDLGADGGRLLTAMQDKLAAALAPGSILPLGQAAGLFWDYRDLIPAGGAGDRLVDALAGRLQRAGLYARAADLLQHRLTGRADDIDKGPLSVRVASLFILAGDPDRAIRTLRDTDAIAYPPTMHADRRRIEAAALDLLGRPAEALATIQDVDGAAGLRAEILWRARDWAGVAAQAVPPAGSIGDVAQAAILRRAISLAMLGREADLAVLHGRYAKSFAGTPSAATFDMLSGDLGATTPETLRQTITTLPSATPAGALGDLIAAGEAAMAHRKPS